MHLNGVKKIREGLRIIDIFFFCSIYCRFPLYILLNDPNVYSWVKCLHDNNDSNLTSL